MADHQAGLKAATTLLGSIVEGSPVPTFVIDADHRVTHWNRACETILGYPASRIVGTRDQWKPFYPMPRPVMADLVVSGKLAENIFTYYGDKFRQSSIIPGSYEAEDFFPQMGRQGTWLYFTAAPLNDADGRLIGAIETLQDVTDKKLTEARLKKLLEEQRLIFDHAHAGLSLIKDRAIVNCNRHLATILGYDDPAELIGQRTQIMFHSEEQWRAVGRTGYEQLTSRGYADFEVDLRRRDRETVWCRMSGRPLDAESPHEGSIWVYTDITEAKRKEEQLELARTVFDHTSEALFVTTPEAQIIEVNRAFTRITGYTAEEAVGASCRLLKSGRHSVEFYKNMWNALISEGAWEGEIWDRRKDGEVYPKWLAITGVRDAAGAIRNYIASFSDISARKAAEDKINYLAHHDPLTGLPNRVLLRDRFRQSIDSMRRSGRKFAFMFLDLDHFKRINDSLGHRVGDELLIGIVRRLRTCLREVDTISRQGGDEFILLIPEIDGADTAREVAERILASLEPPFSLAGQQLSTSFSIGIAIAPNDGEDFDTLLQKADTAMYHAKETARGTYSFFDPAMNERAVNRLDLGNRLRRALGNNEFRLVYQLQIDLLTGLPVGVECLLRWTPKDSPGVAPAEFVPIAEESGMILPIGAWVMAEAARQARLWRDAGRPLKVAINVSGVQVFRSDLAAELQRIAADAGILPALLEVELTESTLLEDTVQMREIIGDLKKLGITVAIDDFGTGYSSLSYLKRFAVDKLKIDQTFITDAEANEEDRAITQTVISVARSLHMKAIAEGVETVGQANFLRESGCHQAQGFFFSPPMPAEAIAAFLAGRQH